MLISGDGNTIVSVDIAAVAYYRVKDPIRSVVAIEGRGTPRIRVLPASATIPATPLQRGGAWRRPCRAAPLTAAVRS